MRIHSAEFHALNLLSERYRRNSWRWAVPKRTAHYQDNSLAAVDAPLSQQITHTKRHMYDNLALCA